MCAEEDLRAALRISAQIVDKYGEDYLPVFLRLEREVAELDERKAEIERARRLAREV